MIKDNIELVKANIEKACIRSGRSVDDVTLIAVSKTKPNEDLQEAMDAGMLEFGENKVQELTGKIEFFNNPDIKWHMIGHLQTNKIKYIIDKVYMIHSVDTVNLAEKISEQAVKKGVTANILIEVNVGLEDTKFGITVDNAVDFALEIAKLPGIIVRGLMTVAPYVENPEDNREIFKKMKQLSVDIAAKNIDNITMDVLSMGMTNDYEIAIEEGATHVRVGTAIFGNRNYNI